MLFFPSGTFAVVGTVPRPGAPWLCERGGCVCGGGLETVWEDVIKVMLAFLLMAPLLTHAAALLSHGFVSGCTQRGAGAEEAFPLYGKVSYKCSLIIWGNK